MRTRRSANTDNEKMEQHQRHMQPKEEEQQHHQQEEEEEQKEDTDQQHHQEQQQQQQQHEDDEEEEQHEEESSMQPTTTTATPTNHKPVDIVDAIFTNSDILMDMEEEEGGGYDLINNLNKDTIEDMMAYSRFPISAYTEDVGVQWRSGHDESNNDYDERGSNDNEDASGSSVAVGGRSSRSSGSSSSSSGSSTTLLQGMMLGEDDLFPTLDNVDNDCCMRDDSAITNNSNTAVSMIEVDDRAILPGRSDRGRGVKFAPIIHPEEDEETVGSTSDRRIVDDDNNSNNNVNDDTPPIILLPPSMSSTYNNTHFDTEIEDLDYGNKQSLKSVEGDHSDYNKFNMSSTTTTAMMTTTTTTTAATIKRKRPTGLGNLGNTCFMNSTLQCLAHTPPLRRYFLSGMYERDLNVDNPLGTGGELAREFASLMREMWLEKVTISTNTVDEENKTRNHPASNGIYASSRMYSSGNGGSYPNTATSHLSNGIGGGGVSSMTPSVTYPRSFKTTLGKHAPQFVGYDQHDSQELAIYLLDALHEDTNRVRKKPYVENPEQSTTESDEYAANKAWDVHLQREDSFIVHNFMGQVKSRLQCPNNDSTTNLAASEEVKEEKEKDACCGRVSTTFDPYMYLSVPIPGSTDRVVKVVFVPRVSSSTSTTDNSSARPVVSAEFTIKLCKNSNLRSLRREVVKSARECYRYTEDELEEDDVQMVDIFNNKIWSYYDDLDRAIDGIKDSDITYAYQLLPLKIVKEDVAKYRRMIEGCSTNDEEIASTSSSLLDATTKAELDNEWEIKLLKFVAKPTAMCHMLNEKKSNHKERLDFYGSLLKFIQKCKHCPDATTETNATNGGSIVDCDAIMASPSVSSPIPAKRLSSSTSQPTLEEVSYTSSQFKGVHTPRDLAVLEYCVSKYLARITKLNRIATNRSSIAQEYKMAVSSSSSDDIINKNENGLVVQVKIKKYDSASSSSYNNYGTYNSYSHDNAWKVVCDVPMVVRISPTLTVSGLRQLLGHQLLHACCFGESKTTSRDNSLNGGDHHNHRVVVETNQIMEFSPEIMNSVMQSVAFSCEGDTSHGSGGRGGGWSMGGGGSNSHEQKQFGSVSLDQLSSTAAPSVKQGRGGGSGVAKAITNNNSIINDTKEMELVASIIKNRSTILVNWPPQFNDVLDESALCAKEEYLTYEQRKAMKEDEDDIEDEEDKGNLSASSNGKKKKKKKGVSIMDCIHKYCEMEQLDESDMWYCNQCKEHVRAWKQFHLYRTPPILIVHLKRFHYSSTTHRRDKIDTLIDFPLVDLDLRSVVKHNHWEVGQEPIYDCYAVSNHFGGLGGGHYTAYARWGNGGKQDKNGEGHGGEEKGGSSSPWCIFDDSRVTTCVDESEVVSNAAYCLYYKRKDVVFDDNDYVVEDNERKIRMSKTTTPTKQQLGVNRPDGYEGREGAGRSMKSEGGLVSMPVSPMHTTPRSSPQPPTPRCLFNDANTNDAAMEEAESCSSATSYVTPNTSLQAKLDVYDEMMNDLI